jgi:hypothetical protein
MSASGNGGGGGGGGGGHRYCKNRNEEEHGSPHDVKPHLFLVKSLHHRRIHEHAQTSVNVLTANRKEEEERSSQTRTGMPHSNDLHKLEQE